VRLEACYLREKEEELEGYLNWTWNCGKENVWVRIRNLDRIPPSQSALETCRLAWEAQNTKASGMFPWVYYRRASGF
jgi:hypothetical protein